MAKREEDATMKKKFKNFMSEINVKMRKGYTRVTENSDTGTKHDTRGI